MDSMVAKRLAELNTRFYAENAASFSDTRQGKWPGWDNLLLTLEHVWDGTEIEPKRVLDVAAGNLRFENYISDNNIKYTYMFYAIENCLELLKGQNSSSKAVYKYRKIEKYNIHIHNCHIQAYDLDVVGALLDGEPALAQVMGAISDRELAVTQEGGTLFEGDPALAQVAGDGADSSFDLAVSFGFMHHIPTPQARLEFVSEMLEAVRPGGVVALSFWRFADEESRRQKAERTTAAALVELGWDGDCLGPGDYLLGWKQVEHSYRYCHSFTETEIDALVSAVADRAGVLNRYRADGKSGTMNEYLVLQRTD